MGGLGPTQPRPPAVRAGAADGHRGGEPYPRATADLHVGLAELDRELDELASAEAHLETARVLGERASITENRHRWFVAMAQVRAARGDFDAAMHLLDEAEALYRHGFYPDIRPIAAMGPGSRSPQGTWRLPPDGPRTEASASMTTPDYLREYDHLTLARLLLAQHRAERRGHAGPPPPLRCDVLALLDRLHAAAAEPGATAACSRSVCCRPSPPCPRRSSTRRWPRSARRLVEAPEPESYVRLYLDEGAPMLALLHHAAAAPAAERTERGASAQRLADARRRRSSGRRPATRAEPPAVPGRPVEPARARRARLLDSELTGPEIARELYVTLNTLRTHTKRIFTKLDVKTRAAAVRRAHERGLSSRSTSLWGTTAAGESPHQSHHVVTPGHPVGS